VGKRSKGSTIRPDTTRELNLWGLAPDSALYGLIFRALGAAEKENGFFGVAIRAPRHFVKTWGDRGPFRSVFAWWHFRFFWHGSKANEQNALLGIGDWRRAFGGQGVPSAVRLSRAAAIVASISGSVWAADTNRASYCEGGKKNPRRSIS
jgi:hypothetical protein